MFDFAGCYVLGAMIGNLGLIFYWLIRITHCRTISKTKVTNAFCLISIESRHEMLRLYAIN